MKYVWPVVLVVVRASYALYSLWCALFPIGVFTWWYYHDTLQARWVAGLLLIAFTLWVMVVVHRYRKPVDPNPWQSAFMAWFGTLRWFRNREAGPSAVLQIPSSYLVENPRGYRINGPHMRAVLECIQPGDVLLRAYEGYVDGEFIRRSSRKSDSGFRPGWFTHAALYVGALTETDRAQVPIAFQHDANFFETGPQRIVHSTSKGVHTEDLLTFLRCDYLVILRLPPTLQIPPNRGGHVQASKQHTPPSLADQWCEKLQRALQEGQSVLRADAITAMKQSALEKIGAAYDFDSSDTHEFHRFSCSELVYYCLRGVRAALNLQPQVHALYPLAPWFTRFHLLQRTTITPDDYYDLVASNHLECIWEDPVSQTKHVT